MKINDSHSFSPSILIPNLSSMWVYLISRSSVMILYILIQWWQVNAVVGFTAVNFTMHKPAKCAESLVRMWITVTESCLLKCFTANIYSVPNFVCVCMCVCIYIHICVYIYVCVYIHTHIHTHNTHIYKI